MTTIPRRAALRHQIPSGIRTRHRAFFRLPSTSWILTPRAHAKSGKIGVGAHIGNLLRCGRRCTDQAANSRHAQASFHLPGEREWRFLLHTTRVVREFCHSEKPRHCTERAIIGGDASSPSRKTALVQDAVQSGPQFLRRQRTYLHRLASRCNPMRALTPRHRRRDAHRPRPRARTTLSLLARLKRWREHGCFGPGGLAGSTKGRWVHFWRPGWQLRAT